MIASSVGAGCFVGFGAYLGWSAAGVVVKGIKAVVCCGHAAALRAFRGAKSHWLAARIEAPSTRPGAACIVEFSHPSGCFFVMVSDNTHIQHLQGRGGPRDADSASTAIRILREEIRLSVPREELELVARWQTPDGGMTDCFFVSVDFELVCHLFPQKMSQDFVILAMNRGPSGSIRSILAIPEEMVEGLEDRGVGGSFSGLHRACLHRLLRLPPMAMAESESFEWLRGRM